MKRLRRADVVMVGLGATGGVAALPLAEAGLSVVALEAGPWRDAHEYGMDEIRNDVRNVMGDAKWNREVPTSRATAADRALPTPNTSPMMNGVGGSVIHYGAWLRRQRRVAESRPPLRGAREAFEALVLRPWSERAQHEQRHPGLHRPDRDPFPGGGHGDSKSVGRHGRQFRDVVGDLAAPVGAHDVVHAGDELVDHVAHGATVG